jgi:hypothetical protein
LTVQLEVGSTAWVNHRQVAYLTNPAKEEADKDSKAAKPAS